MIRSLVACCMVLCFGPQISSVAFSQELKPEEKGKPFEVPGAFSIAAPGPGYSWRELKKIESQGVKGAIYGCTKEGTTDRIALTREERTAQGQPGRVAAAKGHYNGLIQSLNAAKFTDLKVTKPDLDQPIPDKLVTKLEAKGPDGKPSFIGVASVFGASNVFSVMAFAGSQNELDTLLKAVDSLKEIKAEAATAKPGRLPRQRLGRPRR